jgi:hypothetical protein
MSPPIMGNAPIPPIAQELHLILKRIGIERPTMTKHDRLASAPIVEEQFDFVAILLADFDVWHKDAPLRLDSRAPL